MLLSILDQSPVISGTTSAQAIHNTMDLVQSADEWGYHRYWFAEHHASASFASASPEVMMANAAARTKSIRLGSGGILLGHSQPLRVAESIRSLQVLSGGRIDAGFGRAPGGDQRVIALLREASAEAYTRLDSILRLLRNQQAPSNEGEAVAVPDGTEPPSVWVLGTSPQSAVEAARRGLPYAFGHFIDPTHVQEALSMYHANFEASVWGSAPHTMIALVAFAGENADDAQAMARCSEDWFVQSFLRGQNVRFPSHDAPELAITAMEQMIRSMRRSTVLIDSSDNVANQLAELGVRYATQEFAVVTITADHGARRASYEALAHSVAALRS